MRQSYVKGLSILGVIGLIMIFGYIALEDPAHGETWGGSYGENEITITATSEDGTLNGVKLSEDTGFVMAQGGLYTIKIKVDNDDKNDDVDTVQASFPTGFLVNGGSPDVSAESGGNNDWKATKTGATIKFEAVSDMPGVNQTGGGFYYDIAAKIDDALDYTQSGEFTVKVTAPSTTTIGKFTVKVSDSKTERGGAEYEESYPALSVKQGDVFQYVTIKGADVKLTFSTFTPIGGVNPGDITGKYVLLKETIDEKTYIVLGAEGIEYKVEALGGVDATYDLTIETHEVSSASDTSVLTEKTVKSFTGLHTDEVPTMRDTDGDGKYDYEDTDDDNDGWSDAEELKRGTDPLDPKSHPEKEKKFPIWIIIVIVLIVVAIVAYFFLFRGKREVSRGGEEVAGEGEVVEEGEMYEAGEEVYGGGGGSGSGGEGVEEEAEEYEVPAAEAGAIATELQLRTWNLQSLRGSQRRWTRFFRRRSN